MKKIAIILSVILLFIFSCSKTDNNEKSSISINLGPEPKTIDPTLNSLNMASCYIHHAFEGLTKIDSNNNVKPGMAESWNQ